MTIRASQFLGAEVVDCQAHRLGRVTDLLLDSPRPARVCYALIDIGQPARPCGQTVAVPWSVLQPDWENQRLVLDVSLDALRRMSDFRDS